jgi:ankyrin repeat protein
VLAVENVFVCRQVSQTVVAMLAAGNNSKSLDVVLRLGARVDPVDDTGATPLFRASGLGFADVCRVLVAHGANVVFRHKGCVTFCGDASADPMRCVVW